MSRYPTAEECAADVDKESDALIIAGDALSASIEECPLPDILKAWATVELALTLAERGGADADYVHEVLNEIILVRSMIAAEKKVALPFAPQVQ